MSILRREIEFLEREMQRVRTKWDRLWQDPTETPSRSITVIRPKWLTEYHDYYDREQARIQANHENDMCIDPYPTIEQQIWADGTLSRQLHEEEHAQLSRKWVS